MLTTNIAEREEKIPLGQTITILAASLILLALIVTTYTTQIPWKNKMAGGEIKEVATIGKSFMTTYVLPFELVSVLLLIALIGAIILARKETKE
jgi:NADH-quinone oxidoreductase subunit J